MEKRDASNGIACFDKNFQKFECIYHDVDELVKQAESQLLTVGANVKAFFSELDLIGDAASQYSEDENPGAASDTSMLEKTDDAVNIKSLMGSDGGDEVHLGSMESVKSVYRWNILMMIMKRNGFSSRHLTLGSLKKVELGESCILVDTSELECRYAEAAKGKSYKKKLKDAFVSKMRLLKKHNNDEQKNSFLVLPLPGKSNSPDCHEFCESDWEIV